MLAANPCCCQGCAIGDDPFTEADNASVPGWAQVAGTSAIVSNRLKFTASNTMVVFGTTDTAGGIEVNASVNVIAATSGDVAKILIKSDGTTSNYWYAQLTIGSSGTLKLFKVISGTPTQLASVSLSTFAGAVYQFTVCYGNGNFASTVNTVGGNVAFALTTNISTQLSAGLACGSITSNVQFYNFTYNHGYNASTHATCVDCNCTGIFDVCLKVDFIFGALSGTGWDLSAGIGNQVVLGVRGSDKAYFLLFPGSGGGVFPGTIATSGDTGQICLKRTGASCTDCTGDFYVDHFTSTLDPSWANDGSWSTSSNTLVSSLPSTSALIYQYFHCISGSATYTAKFCVNGATIHTESGLTMAIAATAPVPAGLGIDRGTAVPSGLGFKNFYLDIDA